MSTLYCRQGVRRASQRGDFVVRIAQTALAAGLLSWILNSATQRQRWTVWLTIFLISTWLEAMRNGLGGSGCSPMEAGIFDRSRPVTETTGIIDEARLDVWLAWHAVMHVRGVRSQNGY